MNILIIDDNENIVKLLEKYLKLKDHDCTTSNDAKKALGVLDDKKFDAVILDLAMPNFSGLDFLDALSEDIKKQNKIIILTASNISDKDEKDIIMKGAKTILRKPIQLDVLMQEILS